MQQSRVNRRDSAFGLAEVLIALGFLAIILITLASLIISTVRASDEASEMTPALLVARQLVEKTRQDLRIDPSSTDSLDFWDNEYIASPWKSEQVQVGTESFNCQVFTANVQDSSGSPLGSRPENLLKKVRVVVTWERGQERGYGKLREELVTLFAR